MLKYQDIFVPGGFPRHTYNPRVELQLEQKVSEVTENLCKLVTVTGQTKSGKTVLVRKVLPRETAVWVDGGVVSAEDDFWQVIMDQLDLFQASAHESSSERAGTISGKASAGANFLVAKGEGEIGGEVTRASGTTTSQSREVSSRVAALRGLETARVPLVIDDFHYLPRELQGNVIRALKPLIFDGYPSSSLLSLTGGTTRSR